MILLLVLLAVAGIAIWFLVAVIRRTPALMTHSEPCRGRWAEAYLRGCETGIDAMGVPAEPLNTMSNLAYAAAGWLLYVLVVSGEVSFVDKTNALVFALILSFLCLGSSLYHGTKTVWGNKLDRAGMYAVFGALAVFALAPEKSYIHWVMAGAALGAAVGFAFVDPGNLNSRMGLLLGLVSLKAFMCGSVWLAILSLGIFLLAFISWNLDRVKLDKDGYPTGDPLYLGRFGHLIWHFGTSVAITLMFAAVSLER